MPVESWLGRDGGCLRNDDSTMKRPFLTVLTSPVPSVPRRAYRAMRTTLRPFVKPGHPPPPKKRFHGHFALVRSVVEGLEANGADFNYDPRSLSRLARVVYAPANEALRQAADLKRRNRIDFLVAGPSNALFPEEADNILWQPEIDLIIEPSEWVRDLFRTIAPALVPKIRICTAGVDTEAWAPVDAAVESRALVYWKSGEESFCAHVESILEAQGLRPIRLRYGHYTPSEYKRALDDSVVAVFLSAFETQGLALAEAWSMDVPTLVWNPRAEASWRGRSFAAGSSAPYLSPVTGLPWETIEELPKTLAYALGHIEEFHPRAWVLGNMTDARCSRTLLDIIKAESSSSASVKSSTTANSEPHTEADVGEGIAGES